MRGCRRGGRRSRGGWTSSWGVDVIVRVRRLGGTSSSWGARQEGQGTRAQPGRAAQDGVHGELVWRPRG